MTGRAFVLVSLVAAACGRSAGSQPDIGVDAGPPSGYLFTGTITVHDPNTGTGTGDLVDATLVVTRAGQPVDGLQVLVNPPPPSFQTVLVECSPGTYVGNWLNYGGAPQITVRAGRATLLDTVSLAGPDLQHIDGPACGALIDATQPLSITWSRTQAATQCSVSTVTSTYPTTDTGSFLLPAGAFVAPVTDGGPGLAALTVSRATIDLLQGVAPGSRFTFDVAVTTQVLVKPAARVDAAVQDVHDGGVADQRSDRASVD